MSDDYLYRVVALRDDYPDGTCWAWMEGAQRVCGAAECDEPHLCPRHVKMARRKRDLATQKEAAKRTNREAEALTDLGRDPMRVLIACEYSGTERDAFTAAGHDAMSCDLLPTESPGHHHQGDVRDLMGERWDLVIAHPPCTYLSNSGVRWLHTEPGRWAHMAEGAAFFATMFSFDSPRICVENPVQHHYAVEAHGQGKPDQTVQPWQFGHPETKRTCYWLRGLPHLIGTNNVKAHMDSLPPCDRARIHYAVPSPDRWKLRSTSYAGIAQAMADQWGQPQEVAA